MHRAVWLVSLVVVSTMVVATPTVAQSAPETNCINSRESVETPHADIDGVVRQAPNRSDVVRITYQRLSGDTDLEIDLPNDVKIVRADSFTRINEDSADLRYTGSSGETAVIEYKIGVSGSKRQYASGPDWVFAPAPTHIGTGVDVELDPTGVVGNEFLYLGNYTEYSTTVGCHEISFVNVRAGTLPTSGETILDALEYAGENLDVRQRYSETTIFATPGIARPGNPGFADDSDAWVTKSTTPYNISSYPRLVLHEYIHTRQGFTKASIGGMEWVTEGSADYLSYKLGLQTGTVTAREYNRWLKEGNQFSGVLSNRSTWSQEYVDYARGGAYMAVLDAKIRASSNRSLETVIRRLNLVGGDGSPVLVQRHLFLGTVENVSTPTVRAWANESMDSPAAFEIDSVTRETPSLADRLAEGYEQRTAKKPYATLFVGLMLGLSGGLLAKELNDDSDADSTEDASEGDDDS